MGALGKQFLMVWQLILVFFCSRLFVICSASVLRSWLDAPELTLQLRDGSTDSVGRLEIEYYRTYSTSTTTTYKWFGTICDHNFRLEEATVACRQLGYQYAETRTTPYFDSNGYLDLILQEVNCNGNEDRLTDCYYVIDEGMTTCGKSNEVGIACTNEKPSSMSPDASPGDIRLVGGSNPYEGRLEVFLAGTEEWATVCSEHWDFIRAEQVCEKLGYRPATSIGTTPSGEAGTGPVTSCLQTDRYLNTTQCQSSQLCSESVGVEIVCSGREPGRQDEVRLVGDSAETEGRVEFFDQNTWKTLCSDDWGFEEVRATCRQLGLPEPSAAVPSGGLFGDGSGYKQSSVACTGLELNLQSCSWTLSTSCRNGGASARCGTIVNKEVQEFDLRLNDGQTSLEGRLEMFYQGEWGAVCDSNFNMEEATVACRHLGFQSADRQKRFSETYNDYFLNMVNCNGDELNLLDCYHVVNDFACHVNKEVGLVCSNLPAISMPSYPSLGDLQLVGGSTPYEGRVQVFIGGWSTVCGDGIDFSWAEQACQKLGFRPASSVGSGRYGTGSGPLARCPAGVDGFDTENCQEITSIDPTCTHSTDVDIVCNGVDKGRQGQVRLVDGSIETEGQVEFFDKNTWKTLCSDDWGIEEVQSTCRQLGLPEPSSAVPPGGSFGRNGAGDTLPNSIICTGQELTLQNCFWTARAMPCSTGGAGAQCGMRPAAVEFDLRLANGSSITEGRVEMLYQGEWGSICKPSVKNLEATFICNQLGFQYSDGIKSFGRGSGEVLVSGLNCNGNEGSILECYHKLDDSECAQYRYDLGVICSNLPPLTEEAGVTVGDLRLSGGPSLYEGRVEMYISDVIGWATVCEKNVDFGWAVRACQKLEYRPATSFGTMRNTTGGGPIVLCDGGLAAEYCQVVNQTDPTVSCNHMRDVHVVCDGYDTGSFGDIRLQNGTEPTEGSVEIFYENVWRRVCADDWGFEEAKTACYQLGMPVPNNTVPGGTFSGNPNRDFVSQKFNCFALRPLERYRRVNFCPLTRRETPCSAGDAAVQCGIWSDAKEGDIRLNGGAVNSIGRVEIFHADQWGAICHGDTLRKEDTVACRQLGFLSSRSYPYNISYYLPTLPVLLKIEECTGKEENVTECATGFVEDRPFCEGPYCCTFFLKVHCDPRPRVQSFEVSLVNGPYPNQGTVQVMFDGFKGAICHYDWDESEGEVICRQLGYQSLVVAIPGWDAKDLYSYAEEDFLIRDLECEGTEGNLADCYYRIPGDGICSGFSGNQAAVVCYSDEYPSVDPRPTERSPESTRTQNIIIGVVVAVVVFLLLCFACHKMNRKHGENTIMTRTSSRNPYQPDLPPHYNDVTNSPDSYPVVASGSSLGSDSSTTVEQTAV
ncbi:deleted in malignant brain tumors 1 protein-like isoform X2 [Asterias rubens]|uniref:deleted in malignant brain tumors 1 protein-like isoform X2 n=1 Tax=Asterias rubens TaxID=7604 RepID=UPI001454E817|nr:deleted in malignant brain tumors 1 protein-like isoform X2 [Asterias rubens]